uniref:Uncharacterized protein n=1 Tax=Arundo donax TaxID=35708 RepID=A0A0A8Y8W4_ARUDO
MAGPVYVSNQYDHYAVL